MTVSVLWLFLTVPGVGQQCVTVVFADHTHLFFHTFYTLEINYTSCVIHDVLNTCAIKTARR